MLRAAAAPLAAAGVLLMALGLAAILMGGVLLGGAWIFEDAGSYPACETHGAHYCRQGCRWCQPWEAAVHDYLAADPMADNTLDFLMRVDGPQSDLEAIEQARPLLTAACIGGPCTSAARSICASSKNATGG